MLLQEVALAGVEGLAVLVQLAGKNGLSNAHVRVQVCCTRSIQIAARTCFSKSHLLALISIAEGAFRMP